MELRNSPLVGEGDRTSARSGEGFDCSIIGLSRFGAPSSGRRYTASAFSHEGRSEEKSVAHPNTEKLEFGLTERLSEKKPSDTS